MKDHGLLVERYRPTDLDRYVGNEHIKKVIKKYIDNNDTQNLIFHGPAGTGKTTLAKLIVKNIDCDYLYINASDERGIETIRNKVVGFASTMSFKPLKVVILDEADFLTLTAQASLRNVIEKFSKTTRFILTCNYVERILGPLQSRCHTLKILPPSKQDVARHLNWIMSEENITHTPEDIKLIVNPYYPDLRKCIEAIQMFNMDGKLELDKSVLVSSQYLSLIFKELSKSKPSIKDIRQIIADSGVSDFEELFRYLYDTAEEYVPGKEGMVAYYVNEYSYQANFRIDKEINAVALINQILTLK